MKKFHGFLLALLSLNMIASPIASASLAEPIKLADLATTSGDDPNHEANKSLNLAPIRLSSVIEMHSFKAIRQEASYDQSITLEEALRYAVDHNMPIRISKESWRYQHYQVVSNMAQALPSFSMSYNLSHANVFNFDTTSMARTFIAGVQYPVFQGGSIVYGILAQLYRDRGWKYAYGATVSDGLFQVYQSYITLLLNRVLLQINAKAVEVDEEQLAVNDALLRHGTGTRFAVMQSRAQLATDRQTLLSQEVTVREAALALNLALDFPMSVNLVPVEQTITEASMFDPKVSINKLLSDAMIHRPELKQYEMFRLTAARNVQLAASGLYPTVSFFTLYQSNNTQVNPPTNSADLGGVATSTIDSFLNSTFAGRVSNNALGQLPTFSPTSGVIASQGANTGPSATPAASGGTPIANVQSGSLVSSGAVAPSIFGGGAGATQPNTNGSLQAPAGIFAGVFRSFQMGFALNWTLPNIGVGYLTQVEQARVLARQALMQCNEELTLVQQQVRGDYLSMLSARRVIDSAALAVSSSQEELRLAQLRLKAGVGTNLELIQAERDYVTALTQQAQAIVNSNSAQAQLLHDMGLISVDTLTQGYKPGVTPANNWQSDLKP